MDNLKQQKGDVLEVHQKILFIGQVLITVGSGLLSLGQILKLMKEDQLPIYPVQLPSNYEQKKYQSEKSNSYFN